VQKRTRLIWKKECAENETNHMNLGSLVGGIVGSLVFCTFVVQGGEDSLIP